MAESQKTLAQLESTLEDFMVKKMPALPGNFKEVIVKIQKQGLEVVIPDVNAFREKVKPVVAELKKAWAPGLYEKYVKPLLEK